MGEDARRDRIYLPQDEMRRFGTGDEDILARRGGENFEKLMQFQAQRARSFEQGLRVIEQRGSDIGQGQGRDAEVHLSIHANRFAARRQNQPRSSSRAPLIPH